MSVATSEPKELKFLARFEDVWASLRRYQVLRGLCWSFLAAALGVAALCAADFRLELPWTTRAAGLAAAAAVALGVLALKVLVPLRWWTKPRTAVEIEARFPQLGQRIRTVVQFAGRPGESISTEGVAPSLVEALEEETELRAQPLPIARIVPWGRVRAAAALAAAPALVLLFLAASDREWRTALERAFLGRRPYTTLSVAPGSLTVEQGENVPLSVTLQGRLKRKVVLYTRAADSPSAAWKASELEPAEGMPASRRERTLEKIKDSLEYRIGAGPAESPVYRIGVRYPLAFKTFEVALRPPAYTGLKPSTAKGGDLQVVEGTAATFRIGFDAAPSQASLIITDPSLRDKGKASTPAKKTRGKGEPESANRVIPLENPKGGVFTVALDLTKSLIYRIEANTTDGRRLPKNRHRIDVREDRPPRVTFDEPDEALEVHPIAEIRNRIRAGDDFGLTKAGIVFRFNNGDDQTLVAKDFEATPQKRQTSATLEEMLLLEKLAAEPTDSITYYAFAEDNYPGTPKRTETDLRYLDIRPFKREYKLGDSAQGQEGDDESASLGELIARQRFNLNRGVRLARHKPTDRSPGEDPLKVAGFEEAIAKATHELTEGVEGIVGQRIEPFHQAEEAMLAAVEALDRAKFAQSPGHMEQALRHLIEVRRTLIQLIGEDPALAKALRQFDRAQAQKIRKTKKDSEDPEAIAEELEELAEEEDFVYATLASLSNSPGESPKGTKGQGTPSEKSEPPKESGDADKAEQGEKPGEGEMPQEGVKGEKGEPHEGGDKDGSGKAGTKGEQGEEGPNGPDGGRSPGKEKGQHAASGGPKDGPGSQGKEKSEDEGAGKAGDPKDGAGGQGKEKTKNEGAGEAGDPKDGAGDQGKEKAKSKGAGKGEDPNDGAGGQGKEKAESKGGAAEKPEDEDDGAGDGRRNDRREAMERQEKIADTARELEEKLKKLEAISDLAKARMAKAAEAAEKASGELARGSTKDAKDTAKAGAAMLHELARQVKGEVAREVADELAMARDLAEELAEREAELSQMAQQGPTPGASSEANDRPGAAGKAAPKDAKDPAEGEGDKGQEGEKGKGEGDEGQEGEKGREGGNGRGDTPGGRGRGGLGGRGDLTDEERLERLQEAARTLEEWLRGAAERAEGKQAEQIRDLAEQAEVDEVVERMERVGELYLGGQRPEARREATELSRKLEIIARRLDVLHRGIVAPELAEAVEFDRRVAELTDRLKELKTDAEISAWHREAAELARDLSKAGLTETADALRAMLADGGWNGAAGAWHWARDARHFRLAPEAYTTALRSITVKFQERIQEMLLKDLATARDEATPPEYRELVERYYEVLAKDKAGK